MGQHRDPRFLSVGTGRSLAIAPGRRARLAALTLTILLLGAGCGGDDTTGPTPETPVEQAEACLVLLHGKGGDGGPVTLDGDRAIVQPAGTEPGWGGLQWIYAESAPFADGLTSIEADVDAVGCKRIVVHGFSNGASMAAKMYCTGQTLGGRVVGYIVDDPVLDDSSADCGAGEGVEVALYWTGSLAEIAPPGTSCVDLDWTCEGPTVGEIDSYAADLGTEALDSVTSEHERHPDPPEVGEWLAQDPG